jgi:hypothetical protein
MVGENVQVSPGTPLGLGDISAWSAICILQGSRAAMHERIVRFAVGQFTFQGRRFDLDP